MEKAIDEILQILNAAKDSRLLLLDRIFGKNFDPRRKVIIYGAGILGGELVNRLATEKVTTSFFIDSNHEKSGSLHEGVPVKHIDDVCALTNSYIVIATQGGYDEIECLLEQKLHSTNSIIRLNHDLTIAAAIANPTHEMVKGLRVTGSDALLNKLLEDRDEVEIIYSKLHDQKSKRIFTMLLACSIDHDNLKLLGTFLKKDSEPVAKWGNVALFGYPESRCYFDNELIHIEDGMHLVDIGAYDGCSTESFIRMCKQKKLTNFKSLAFEPDPDNFQILAEKYSESEDVEIRNIALWSQKTTLTFQSSKTAVLKSSSAINDEGDVIVEAIPLDELNFEKISIIKADPPGLDVAIEVLKGATETIKRIKPTLIFPGYHSFEAIYRMPLMIEKLFPETYNIYIRHLSWSMGETDIFAIPK